MRFLGCFVAVALYVALFALPAKADEQTDDQCTMHSEMADDARHDMNASVATGDLDEAKIWFKVALHEATVADGYCGNVDRYLLVEELNLWSDAGDGGVVSMASSKAHVRAIKTRIRRIG